MCKKNDVIRLLNLIGVSTKYIGYDYIVEESLLISKKYDENVKIVLRDINESIARKYKTKIHNIEKNIRCCIEYTFNYGNIKNIDKLFSNVQYYYSDRPTNKMFLTTVVNYLNNK